jgi:hypothetical protein
MGQNPRAAGRNRPGIVEGGNAQMTDQTPVDPTPAAPPPAPPPAPDPAPASAPPPSTTWTPPASAATAAGARPTGITILAVLSAIGGVLGLFGGFVVLGLGATILGGAGVILALALLALAALSIALAWGFWTLQPWAWPLGVVLQAANIILAIVQFLTADTSIVSTIISVGIAGAILYYLNQPTIKSLFGRA